MKHIISAALAAALIVMPLAVRADQPGGSTAMQENSAAFAIMQQTHARIEQMHAQARASMLTSLSPAHRSLLAQVVGQLAIAPTPDATAAARELDANLAPAEAKAILGISASLEQQVRQVMDAAHKQMQSAMPQGQAPHGAWGMHGMHGAEGQMQNDPGMILLVMAVKSAGLGEFHHMGLR